MHSRRVAQHGRVLVVDEDPGRLQVLLEWVADAGHVALGAQPSWVERLLAVSHIEVLVVVGSDAALIRCMQSEAPRPRVCWLSSEDLAHADEDVLSWVDELLPWPIARVDLVAAVDGHLAIARRASALVRRSEVETQLEIRVSGERDEP